MVILNWSQSELNLLELKPKFELKLNLLELKNYVPCKQTLHAIRVFLLCINDETSDHIRSKLLRIAYFCSRILRASAKSAKTNQVPIVGLIKRVRPPLVRLFITYLWPSSQCGGAADFFPMFIINPCRPCALCSCSLSRVVVLYVVVRRPPPSFRVRVVSYYNQCVHIFRRGAMAACLIRNIPSGTRTQTPWTRWALLWRRSLAAMGSILCVCL